MFSSHHHDNRAIVIGTILILLVGGIVVQQFWKNRTASDEALKEARSSSDQRPEELPTIDPDVVWQKILNNEKVVFLDFRDAESYKQEHIPHSLPLAPSFFDSYNPEENALLVAVLSSINTRSTEAIHSAIRKKPFKIFLLAGGFENWKQRGYRTISYGDPASLLDQSKVTYITQEEIQKSDLNFIMLDVQSMENYRKKHIAGALHIPLDQLEKRVNEIPKFENIVVYGENEIASFQGAVRLAGLDIITSKALRGNTHLQPESIFLLEP